MTEQDSFSLDTPAGAEPVSYSDVIEQLTGVKRDAKSLIGATFRILRGKPFQSRFENQDRNPWFIVGALSKSGELFNTVLGGAAVVDVLEAYAASNPAAPLEVTLNFTEGGQFEGYYSFS